jgi:crotonobetainyl-CoA:carnitine CoA-transferase CaiB-like acyl-CoA transferase
VTGPAAGPLADVRVVEMGQLLAGPFCGQLLADFGAEVIKLEDPATGDPMRQWGREKPHGLSLWWPVIARNKKSVTLNLRHPEGQSLARRLLGAADVLVENFRPGTLERWGLGYDALAERNPGLVLVRVTGFGQDGPYAPRAGYGSIGEAMGGCAMSPATRRRRPAARGSRSATPWPGPSPPSGPCWPCTPAAAPAAARWSTRPSTRPSWP